MQAFCFTCFLAFEVVAVGHATTVVEQDALVIFLVVVVAAIRSQTRSARHRLIAYAL